MPTIKSVVLHNFKKFRDLELHFADDLNILVGDNETGKSSILLAIDLVLSGSRGKVESAGLERLFNHEIIQGFLAGPRTYDGLPLLFVDIYLSSGMRPELNGKTNSKKIEVDGLRMECAPRDELSEEISAALADERPNFPFEYYSVSFLTFAGDPYSGFNKYVRHLSIDSSRIDSEYAVRDYTRSMFEVHSDGRDRNKLENLYRRNKSAFRDDHLKALNKNLSDCQFGVRTDAQSNLESDLMITEGGIPIENKGKGRQCFVKTEFALKRSTAQRPLDVLLLEEPENHLSHGNMKQLISRLAEPTDKQIIVATHSSLVSSRLDLRKTLLLGNGTPPAALRDLPKTTAEFFMKASDSGVLEFVLSRKVILVEGDAEFILMDCFYKTLSGRATLASDAVHVISVGGTSFKRYLDLAKLLKVRTAVIRDNDGDYQTNCVDNYVDYALDHIQIFSDRNPARRTLEICLYEDNKSICEKLFGQSRRSLAVREYMLANKTEAAFELATKSADELMAPSYMKEAIDWIRR